MGPNISGGDWIFHIQWKYSVWGDKIGLDQFFHDTPSLDRGLLLSSPGLEPFPVMSPYEIFIIHRTSY